MTGFYSSYYRQETNPILFQIYSLTVIASRDKDSQAGKQHKIDKRGDTLPKAWL